MTPDEIEIGASYSLTNGCDIRILKREEVAGGFVRFQVEKVSGRRIGDKRWEFADYLRFSISDKLSGPEQTRST